MAAERVDNVVKQWASSVVDFSSQYGGENSISYTAQNLAGPSTVYPTYGDFTQACVMRTYGPWWKQTPQAAVPFGRKHTTFCSEDFIELAFEEKVYPTKIDIYETYNPGAVVRILACDSHCSQHNDQIKWAVLWTGRPKSAPAESRILSPEIQSILFPTNLLRLEFNHDYCDYYTEVDAVKLCGYLFPPPGVISGAIREFQGIVSGQNKLTDTDSGQPPCLVSSTSKAESVKRSTDIVVKELVSLHLQDGLSAALDCSDNGDFDLLPGEVIQLIVSYLDLRSLCQLSQVCHLFYKHCYDPVQYIDVCLQPHWTKVTDSSLDSLHSRCRHLQRLDLSWCGSHNMFTTQALHRLLTGCGKDLLSVRLACCGFVDNQAIKSIATHCPLLQELDLQSNHSVDNLGYIQLTRLTHLRRLNLYRTMIDIHSLVAIVRCCPDLQHLNIGSCCSINSYDDLAVELSQHCKNLRSLDTWRAKSLSEIGLHALGSGCNLLEEVDFGWCSNLRSESGCFQWLVKKCPNLSKLFLTANRTVCDADIDAIATHLRNLQQLDILGTREVSKEAAQRLLEQCKCLQFFDVSFCAGIEMATLEAWRLQYPHVQFKQSFQN